MPPERVGIKATERKRLRLSSTMSWLGRLGSGTIHYSRSF